MRSAFERLDAELARAWLASAADQLERHRGAIDDLNVFPVPDADTGTNLATTLRAAAAAAVGESAVEVFARATKAAVLNARGNSGVIVSQFLRGFAEHVGPGDVDAVRACLKDGAELATAAVAEPRAGTMLTVMAAAAGAQGADLPQLSADALARAQQALAQTPEQLPELARAGVVDAGGQGVVVMLEALACAISGAPFSPPPPRRARSAAALRLVREGGSPEFAFEVQYLLESDEDAVPALQGELSLLGDSVVVVGTGAGTLNVHVHVNDVGAAIEAGLDRGRVRRLSVIHFLDADIDDGAVLIVVAPPDGLEGLFQAEGVLIAEPDQIRVAIGSARRAVVLTSTTGASIADAIADARASGCEVAVVPTRSPLQALSAIAVHDRDRRFQDDVIAMAEAAAATHYAEVRAAESDALTTIGPCRRGDVLGWIDGEVVHIGAEVGEVAVAVTDRLLGTGGELITMLLGADSPPELDRTLGAHITALAPFTEVASYAVDRHACPLMIGLE